MFHKEFFFHFFIVVVAELKAEPRLSAANIYSQSCCEMNSWAGLKSGNILFLADAAQSNCFPYKDFYLAAWVPD